MTVIKSRQNQVFKDLKQVGKKGQFKDSFIAEGLRLVETVIASGIQSEALVLEEGFSEAEALFNKIEDVIVLSKDLFAQVSDTSTPQGVLLIAKKPESGDFSSVKDATRVMVLDRVQDPGNVGTLIRLAAGLGFSAVLLIEGSANPYEAKTMRSAMGATFQVPLVIDLSFQSAYNWLKVNGFRICVADMGGQDLALTKFTEKSAIVLGNEGNGISDSFRESADEIVSIPLANDVESLNVAAAGAIIAYQMIKE